MKRYFEAKIRQKRKKLRISRVQSSQDLISRSPAGMPCMAWPLWVGIVGNGCMYFTINGLLSKSSSERSRACKKKQSDRAKRSVRLRRCIRQSGACRQNGAYEQRGECKQSIACELTVQLGTRERVGAFPSASERASRLQRSV